jgi:hypothetical protein
MANPAPKKATARELKAVQARRVRGHNGIAAVLKENDLIIVANRVKVIHNENGKVRNGGELALETLAQMCGLPTGTMLIPQVSLEPSLVSQRNGTGK